MGFSTYGYRTISESAIDNEVPLYLSGANRQAVSRAAPGAGEGGLDVFADELIQEHAGGKIARFGYGSAASPTWVFEVTKDGVTSTKLYDSGGATVNVKSFGDPSQIGNNRNDATDSNAIDAAIAHVKTLASQMGEGRMTTLVFPAGRYNIVRPIDLGGLSGLKVTGAGVDATMFALAYDDGRGSAAATAAYWSQKSMMDVTGANFQRLQDFTIAPQNESFSTAAIPECGLLCATNAPFTNWHGDLVPANIANAMSFDHVRVAGAFLKGAHISMANVSSVYYRCDFARYPSPNPSYPTGVNANEAALVLSRDNQVGVHQAGAVPIADPVAMGLVNGDLTFFGIEVHDHCGTGGGTCNCPAVWIEEGYSIRFYGGNWSGRGNPSGYLRLSPGANPAGNPLYGCHTILLDGVQWYEGDAISAANAPASALRLTGNVAENASVSRANVTSDAVDPATYEIVASDITLRNMLIRIRDGGQVVSAGRGDSAAVSAFLHRLRLENVRVQETGTGAINPGSAYVARTGGSTVFHLRDSVLEANGMGIDLNGGSAKRTPITMVGPVAGSTTTHHGEAQRSGGGAVALAAGGTAYYGHGSANATEASVVPINVSQRTRIYNLRVSTATAPGVGQTLSCTLRKGAPGSLAGTALAPSIAGTSRTGTAGSATGVIVDDGEVMTMQVTASAGAAGTAWVAFSWSEDPA